MSSIGDRVPPNLKFAILILVIPIFTLYTLALVGCISTSPGIPSLFLFLLQVNELTLRVGYFAICSLDANNATAPPLSNGTSASSDGTICVPTLGTDAQNLSQTLFGGTSEDVIPVLELAMKLQRDILIPLILLAALLMLFGAILFALSKVTQMKLKNPTTWDSAMKQLKIFKPLTLSLLWLSVLFAFAAAVGSTMGIGALNFIIPVLSTNISVTAGKMLQAFQYLAFIFGAIFAVGATLMLSDKAEQQQGYGGDQAYGEEYAGGEKGLEGGEYDESLAQQEGQYPEGAAEGQYPEGEYPEGAEGQYPEGQLPEGAEGQYPEGAEGQYPEGYPEGAEGQQYAEGAEGQYPEGYPEGQYPEGGEYPPEQYDEAAYAQQQQQQQQQQQPGGQF